MSWNKVVGDNVRKLRIERKLTQEQLAHDAEIDVTYLRGIEAGRRNPSVAVVGRISAALNSTPRDLFSSPTSMQ
ncbi:helix-turn-helix domain-containing protein [Sphingorhabdus lacus]|uniref:helix-turn-helix domain-containing protein n=1 Tax=Sphingorhabdus lacus TaxID=392610 RepID=UPI003593217B